MFRSLIYILICVFVIACGQETGLQRQSLDLDTGIDSLTIDTLNVEYYRGRSANGTTVDFVENATMTRTAAGQWQIRFAGNHPYGDEYTVTTQAEEQGNLRDTPDITTVQGTQNNAGFDIQITTGDNGGTADGFVDTPWSWSVERGIEIYVP